VAFLRNLLRVYSWMFETILCLMALAVAGAVVVSGAQTIDIGWLPWMHERLMLIMLLVGIAGLLAVGLAIAGRLRILLFLFSLYTCYLIVSGLFLNQAYSFHGPDDARNGVFLAVGSALAVVGAWPTSTARRR
jgi:hypothetical protein